MCSYRLLVSVAVKGINYHESKGDTEFRPSHHLPVCRSLCLDGESREDLWLSLSINSFWMVSRQLRLLHNRIFLFLSPVVLSLSWEEESFATGIYSLVHFLLLEPPPKLPCCFHFSFVQKRRDRLLKFSRLILIRTDRSRIQIFKEW